MTYVLAGELSTWESKSLVFYFCLESLTHSLNFSFILESNTCFHGTLSETICYLTRWNYQKSMECNEMKEILFFLLFFYQCYNARNVTCSSESSFSSKKWKHFGFYRTRVRSFVGYPCQWLTHSLTHSLLFSRLDWCDPGVWRCLLKTADLEVEVWS